MLGSIDLALAGKVVPMVEVAGIEPVRTFGKPRKPLDSSTKSREPSDPVGSLWVRLLTPSTREFDPPLCEDFAKPLGFRSRDREVVVGEPVEG